jgi:DNA mismatch repair protein MutL
MMACKAAIKAGQRLAPPEIETLLAARGRVERSSRCPHGRPTTLRIGLKELERRFGRR